MWSRAARGRVTATLTSTDFSSRLNVGTNFSFDCGIFCADCFFPRFKRIVLFDTLLEESERLKLKTDEEREKEAKEKEEQSGSTEEKEKKKTGCNNEEIVAVLGHELGHWSMNHVLKNILIAQVGKKAFAMIFEICSIANSRFKSSQCLLCSVISANLVPSIRQEITISP